MNCTNRKCKYTKARVTFILNYFPARFQEFDSQYVTRE